MIFDAPSHNHLWGSFAKHLSFLSIVAINKGNDRQPTNSCSFTVILHVCWSEWRHQPWENCNCNVPPLFAIHTISRYLFTLSTNGGGVHWIRGRTNTHALLRIAEWLEDEAAVFVLLAGISNLHGCIYSTPSFIIHIQREKKNSKTKNSSTSIHNLLYGNTVSIKSSVKWCRVNQALSTLFAV